MLFTLSTWFVMSLFDALKHFGVIEYVQTNWTSDQQSSAIAVLFTWTLLLVAVQAMRPSGSTYAVVGTAEIPASGMATMTAPSNTAVGSLTKPREHAEESPVDQLDRIRTHEAGHAAVALYLGFAIEEVSTIRKGNSGGRVVIHSHPDGNRANSAFWKKAIMASAGIEAEHQVYGTAEAAGASADVIEVQGICSALAAARFKVDGKELTASELQDEAQRRAQLAVTEHLDHIQAIAECLKVEPAIDGARAVEVYKSVGEV